MSKDTVDSYIDLLEKSFVLFRLRGFSRNLRKEIVKMKKVYFYDLGIRNTLIDNMKRLNIRDDGGKLWENFLLIERQKALAYAGRHVNPYFWRTYTGAELDYVEEGGGALVIAIEIERAGIGRSAATHRLRVSFNLYMLVLCIIVCL